MHMGEGMKRCFCLAVFFTAAILFGGGCTKIKTNGMLAVDPGQKNASVEGVKFALLDGEQNLTGEAGKYYPDLFSDDFTSLPVIVIKKCEEQTNKKVVENPLGFVGMVYLAILAPVPFFNNSLDCTGHILCPGIESWLVRKSLAYSWIATEYASYNPVSWIFMPFYHESLKNISTEQTVIENVARAVQHIDPVKLRQAQEYRRARLQQVIIEGRSYWAFLGLGQSENARAGELEFDTASVMLFSERPRYLDKPQEEVPVARRQAGQWKTQRGYLRHLGLDQLMAVSVVMEDGMPARAVVSRVVEPPLDDFIDLPEHPSAEDIRWSNNALVEAKNTSLLRLMRQGSRTELASLITRIEKEVLSLSEKVQVADTRVQQIVVTGGDPKTANEMAVLYRQRITMFEAILSGLKRAGRR